MDTVWLEDFLALVDHANFSRAAEHRNVTQPAFSRRIRMLEDWVGTALIDRDTHQIALTTAGERFRPVADEILRRLSRGQEEAREAALVAGTTLRFASTHALSLTFFPTWLRSLEAEVALGAVNLIADNMEACEQLMLQGRASFLLCHHHPAAPSKLNPQAFQSITLGSDTLVPVSGPGSESMPLHALPGGETKPVAFLAYSPTSGLGRILAGARATDGMPAWLQPVFTSHLAVLLKSMALSGRGVAWSPLSLVDDDLSQGRLVRAGDAAWDIPLQIRLFRPRSRQNQAAEKFWSLLTEARRAVGA